MSLDETDVRHLRRCVELAREALEAGDQPFGSLLVDGSGVVRREERNRAGGGDETQHPELALAQWSASLTAEERAGSTVYTSGEHCPMCSAAHAWVGLAKIVYAGSTEQYLRWRAEAGITEPSPVSALPVQAIAPHVLVDGPAPELADELRELHLRHLSGGRSARPEE